MENSGIVTLIVGHSEKRKALKLFQIPKFPSAISTDSSTASPTSVLDLDLKTPKNASTACLFG